jgi:hypothetical protein
MTDSTIEEIRDDIATALCGSEIGGETVLVAILCEDGSIRVSTENRVFRITVQEEA